MDLENRKIDFRSYGQTKVKGEWIRTIGKPAFDRLVWDHGNPEIWVTCKVKGEIRKATLKPDVQVEVLSCPQKNCRTDKFIDDQNMFLYIKSPAEGYLSVFLDDGTTVDRLVPYRRMGAQNAVTINGEQEYILFSHDIENFNTPADRIELFTTKDQETNTIVVVFSENEFPKSILNEEQTDQASFITPKSLSTKSFERCLGDNKAADTDFLDLQKKIVIRKE